MMRKFKKINKLVLLTQLIRTLANGFYVNRTETSHSRLFNFLLNLNKCANAKILGIEKFPNNFNFKSNLFITLKQK